MLRDHSISIKGSSATRGTKVWCTYDVTHFLSFLWTRRTTKPCQTRGLGKVMSVISCLCKYIYIFTLVSMKERLSLPLVIILVQEQQLLLLVLSFYCLICTHTKATPLKNQTSSCGRKDWLWLTYWYQMLVLRIWSFSSTSSIWMRYRPKCTEMMSEVLTTGRPSFPCRS